MSRLRLQPTEMAEWHALIKEAQSSCDIQLEEDLECYLVMLMMRFVKEHSLADSILAMEYLEAHEENRLRQGDLLQTVGDKCLLFSGLFPSNAEARRVKVSYYVELGRSAYFQASEVVPNNMQSFYMELCKTFTSMRDVLQATRELDQSNEPMLTQLAAIELWQDTGSLQALKTLEKFTDSTPHLTTPKSRH